jgi:hypothetical protein
MNIRSVLKIPHIFILAMGNELMRIEPAEQAWPFSHRRSFNTFSITKMAMVTMVCPHAPNLGPNFHKYDTASECHIFPSAN